MRHVVSVRALTISEESQPSASSEIIPSHKGETGSLANIDATAITIKWLAGDLEKPIPEN